MNSKATQYTVRNVPPRVDRALKQRAAERKQSLNATVLEVLGSAVGESAESVFHDLDFAIGSWVRDPKVDRALAEQRKGDNGAEREVAASVAQVDGQTPRRPPRRN